MFLFKGLLKTREMIHAENRYDGWLGKSGFASIASISGLELEKMQKGDTSIVLQNLCINLCRDSVIALVEFLNNRTAEKSATTCQVDKQI